LPTTPEAIAEARRAERAAERRIHAETATVRDLLSPEPTAEEETTPEPTAAPTGVSVRDLL